MSRLSNIAAASIAILAILYLFVLPAVNPPASTGAQWLTLHAPLPATTASLLVFLQSAEHIAMPDASAASFDILKLDSIRRC